MKKIVKVMIHDWPKRTQSRRDQVIVEAETDEQAFVEALLAARILWPGGKVKAFDVRPAKDDEPLSLPKVNAVVEGVEKVKRETLRARA